MAFKQPEPTKAYAIYFEGAWYGEGDTAKMAWADVHRQLAPQHDRYGAALYAKIRRSGRAQMSNAESERQAVMAYVEEGLGG